MSSDSIKELVKSVSSLYLSESFTDVTLVVEGEEIKAHKVILASRNKVLNSMLIYDTVETKKNVIEIPDADIATFKVFLKYLYTGIVENEDLTLELLILADKYLDQMLKDTCESFLCKDINLENAIDKILVANRHSCKMLEYTTAVYMANHIDEFMVMPKFEEILESKDVTKSIFKESKALLNGIFEFLF